MSFVELAVALCPVCGKEHNFNTAVLINKRLKDIKKEELRPSEYTLCKEDHEKNALGYLALVVINNPHGEEQNIKLEDANRTGEVIHIRRHVFDSIFNTKVDPELPMTFIDVAVAKHLKSMMPEDNQ